MKLPNKESQLTPPHVEDKDLSKALVKVYKDLNDLKESVHNFKGKEVEDIAEGKEGDIRVVKAPSSKAYTLQIRGDESWLEDKTAKYVPLKGDTDVQKEQKKKTLPKSVGGLLPPADYDSGWRQIDNSTHHRSTAGLIISHNLKSVPRLVQLFCSEDNAEDEYHGTLQGLTENHSHGITYLINSSNLTIWASDTGIFRLVHGAGTNTDVTNGYIRAYLWK